MIVRADLGGGCRGCAPPTPRDDLRFSNTTGVLPKKKKLCGLLVLTLSKRRVHPLLKKILDPPLIVLSGNANVLQIFPPIQAMYDSCH